MRTNELERKALCAILDVKDDDLGFYIAHPMGIIYARKALVLEAKKRCLTTAGKNFVKKLEQKLTN
jgi:hypothetical protein